LEQKRICRRERDDNDPGTLDLMSLSTSMADAVRAIRRAAGSRRIAFVSGTFNILHVGHLRLLRFAKECADYLVVGVNSASVADNAIFGEQERLEGIRAVSWVDYSFVLNERPEQFIEGLRPSVVVKGREFETRDNPERAVLESYGGKLLFGSGDTTFSSLDLIREETTRINRSIIVMPAGFAKRHGISLPRLGELLSGFSGLRVCVLGDLIVDDYLQCDPVGMSQEDPTIVVTPILRERFLGGAGIVAAHAKALGASSVSLVSVTGRDEAAVFARDKLAEYGVEATLLEDDSRPTTLKQRYRAAAKTLLRVNHFRQHRISAELHDRALRRACELLPQADLLIFADFSYGALPQGLVDSVVQDCATRGIMMVADSQCSSQVGDISRFRGMKLVTPTEREARMALGNYDDGLVVLAERLRQRSGARNVLITLGTEGLLIHAEAEMGGPWPTDRLPAFNTAPRDPAGAGDSLLVAAALAIAAGGNIWEAAYLGSVAAGCQVGRVGNLPLTAQDLRRELNGDASGAQS
jgi:rfaE bifunctional protein kinase chain/domain